MQFRHISAKIQPKNLKQHFDWRGGKGLRPGYALVTITMIYFVHASQANSSLFMPLNKIQNLQN